MYDICQLCVNDTFKGRYSVGGCVLCVCVCLCKRLEMKMNFSVLWIAYLSYTDACDGINRLKKKCTQK